MEKQTCIFAEKIGGQIFIVNMRPSEEAKHSADEYIKDLVKKESMALKADCS